MSAPKIVSTPIQYIREFATSLDFDVVFTTTANRTAYLTSARRYAGMVVVDLQEEIAYFLNAARTAWIPIGVADNKVTITISEDQTYTLAQGFLIDKILITPTATDTIKVGLTVAGNEIMVEEVIVATTSKAVNYDIIAKTGPVIIYFTGPSASCEVIMYIRTL